MKKILKNKLIYVFLGLAAAVVTVSGFLGRLNDFNNQVQEYSDNYEIEIPEPLPTQELFKDEPKATEDKPLEPEAEQVSAEVKPVSISLPLEGELLKEHSQGELVYDKTMEDWRTHNGIDIAAPVGTAVKAAADGVVEGAGFDGLYGYCITVNHGSFLTKYCGLQESDIIGEGAAVKCGEVIGGVGVTAVNESADSPHLHFELIKDDVRENPLIYVENQ